VYLNVERKFATLYILCRYDNVKMKTMLFFYLHIFVCNKKELCAINCLVIMIYLFHSNFFFSFCKRNWKQILIENVGFYIIIYDLRNRDNNIFHLDVSHEILSFFNFMQIKRFMFKYPFSPGQSICFSYPLYILVSPRFGYIEVIITPIEFLHCDV